MPLLARIREDVVKKVLCLITILCLFPGCFKKAYQSLGDWEAQIVSPQEGDHVHPNLNGKVCVLVRVPIAALTNISWTIRENGRDVRSLGSEPTRVVPAGELHYLVQAGDLPAVVSIEITTTYRGRTNTERRTFRAVPPRQP